VDLNGDGNIDLLAESYNGRAYILYGKTNGSFEEAVILKDKSGTAISMGIYYVAKTKAVKTPEKGDFKADFIKAYDWDNDGDLDLFISGKNGEGVKLCINEGTKTNPVFSTKNIDILREYQAEAIVDWDGDGLWDIIGGSSIGHIYFHKNIGELGAPVFEEAKCIFEPIEMIFMNLCQLTQIAVADYNNDGKLDLIIGNQIKPKLTIGHIEDKDLSLKKSNEITNYSDDCYGYIWVSLRNSTTTE
jgi:hypothetical protein